MRCIRSCSSRTIESWGKKGTRSEQRKNLDAFGESSHIVLEARQVQASGPGLQLALRRPQAVHLHLELLLAL
jgi:hypothetical protein